MAPLLWRRAARRQQRNRPNQAQMGNVLIVHSKFNPSSGMCSVKRPVQRHRPSASSDAPEAHDAAAVSALGPDRAQSPAAEGAAEPTNDAPRRVHAFDVQKQHFLAALLALLGAGPDAHTHPAGET